LSEFFAESYVKLQYFVTVLFLITLQDSVCVPMPGEVDSFDVHCLSLIAAVTCQI